VRGHAREGLAARAAPPAEVRAQRQVPGGEGPREVEQREARQPDDGSGSASAAVSGAAAESSLITSVDLCVYLSLSPQRNFLGIQKWCLYLNGITTALSWCSLPNASTIGRFLESIGDTCTWWIDPQVDAHDHGMMSTGVGVLRT
jgi:hypothetical protein